MVEKKFAFIRWCAILLSVTNSQFYLNWIELSSNCKENVPEIVPCPDQIDFSKGRS